MRIFIYVSWRCDWWNNDRDTLHLAILALVFSCIVVYKCAPKELIKRTGLVCVVNLGWKQPYLARIFIHMHGQLAAVHLFRPSCCLKQNCLWPYGVVVPSIFMYRLIRSELTELCPERTNWMIFFGAGEERHVQLNLINLDDRHTFLDLHACRVLAHHVVPAWATPAIS
jgi:hypothetical protein